MTKTIMTPRKEAIMRMLEDNSEGCLREYGGPPCTATTITAYIHWFGGREDGDREQYDPSVVQSFARTLRGMAAEGLVVRVIDKQDTLNRLAGNHIPMPRVAYYSAVTYERDSTVMTKFSDRSNVIDGDFIRELSGASDTFSIAEGTHTVSTLCVGSAAPSVGLDGEWQLL
jgi:hypothetical protein